MLGRAAVTGLGAIVLLGGGAIGAVAATHVGGETPLGSVDMRKADDEPTLILVDDDDDGRAGGGGDDGLDQLTNSVSNSAPSVSAPSRSAGDTTAGDTTASNDGTGGGCSETHASMIAALVSNAYTRSSFALLSSSPLSRVATSAAAMP